MQDVRQIPEYLQSMVMLHLCPSCTSVPHSAARPRFGFDAKYEYAQNNNV